MKYQVLFSLKNNDEKNSRLSSAAVVIGALRVNICVPRTDRVRWGKTFMRGKMPMPFISIST